MTTQPKQLVLDLAHRSANGEEDFIVTGSNAGAVAAIDSWPDWQPRALAIVGPAHSGKSHLASVWQSRSGAYRISASSLDEAAVRQAEAAGALVVEDIDKGIASQQVLFHLLNLTRQSDLFLIASSSIPPGDIDGLDLPDLRSRLRALPVVSIEPPDEQLLKVLLVKLFSDRQLQVDPPAVNFLARHLDRSWTAAAQVVAKIDELALATHRRVTRSLASEALQTLNHDHLN